MISTALEMASYLKGNWGRHRYLLEELEGGVMEEETFGCVLRI